METNTATPLNPFSGFSKRSTRYEIDLSECTLIEAVQEYEKFKRISSPTYSLSSLVYNLEIVQVLSGGRLYPDAVTDLFYSTFISWLCDKGINYNSIKLYCSQIRAVRSLRITHLDKYQ